jgi:cysteinyl-tRNA synthetase
MCDSFNTFIALNVLLELVGRTNIYISRSKDHHIGVIQTVAEWVTRMLKMFGLGEGMASSEIGGIGWGKAGVEAAESGDVS